MGGDNAPDAILAGGLEGVGLLSADDSIALVGDEAVIREGLAKAGMTDHPQIEVVPTTQVVAMDDSPVTALRSKPDSSIVKLARLGSKRAGDQRCDVIISAGNTGACVAAAQMFLRRLPGVTRPGIAVTIPTFYGPIIVCDVGANPEPKPHHLHQYAHMGSVYGRRIIGMDDPRVAVLSIGGEEGKGNALTVESAKRIKGDDKLNYVGYVEGRDLFANKADVVITEGFTGNVVLKLAEGLAAGLFKTIAREIAAVDPQSAAKFEPVVKSIYAKHDYHEYGGAPLMGANGICLICHGSSEARTIRNAVRSAIKYGQSQVNEAIVDALGELEPVTEDAA